MEQKPRRSMGTSLDGFIQPQSKSKPKPKIRLDQLQKETNSEHVRSTPAPAPKPIKPIYTKTKEASEFNPYNLTYSNRAHRKAPKNKRKWSLKKKIVVSILAVLLIIFGAGVWYGSTILSSLNTTFHGNIFSDVHALISGTTLKGEAQGRVNILIAGDSADDPDHQGAQLTDSIMVLSIDTRNHTGFMLSIPRDLRVYIPGLGSYQKINAANEVSMNELQQIVQTDLGIPIDYRALVDYGAFRDAVDAVGGIRIDIQSSDPRGLYDAYTHLKLPNGWVNLNGQEALNLARARGDASAGDVSYGFPGTDFSRTQDQRQMVVAIVKKAMTAGVLANPSKVSSLVKAVGNNVKTDMNIQDVLRLAQIGKSLNLSNLGSYTYSSTTTGIAASKALLTSYTDPVSGEESLVSTAGVGQYGQLQEYYQQLISNNPVVKENASVVLLNGSGVTGLAKKDKSILQANKIDNITAADAYSEYPGTMIIDESDNQDPATKALLQRLFPGTVVTSSSGSAEAEEAQNYNANFVVVLGQNSTSIKQP